MLDELEVYGERHRYIPVLASSRGFRINEVQVDHKPRLRGKSKFGWERYFGGFFSLLTVIMLDRYTNKPLHFFGFVGVVTLTGLGLKFNEIAIAYACGSLVLTAVYTALIVWIVGLAVPVTASYIICAVIAAPALIRLGVPDFAAHMFIFYYAVLSEVSPSTALSPFAAAAACPRRRRWPRGCARPGRW